MSEVVTIKQIGVEEIEVKFKRIYSKADLYIDFEKINCAMITDNAVNRIIYAEAKWSDKIDEVKSSKKMYSCSKLCATFAKNELDFVENSELFSMICDTSFVVEFHAFVLLTAGYKIGMACLREIYDRRSEHPSVSYIMQFPDGKTRTVDLTEEEIYRIANIFFVKDMKTAASLGYLYYNKPERISKQVEGGFIKSVYAAQNTSRFGMENSPIDKPAKLMKYLTDFIPVGYSFSGYTPFIFTVESFVNQLKDRTILGLDMVVIPNYVQASRIRDEITSIAWYTTKRRLYDVLGFDFDYYSFQFIYGLMCSLFLVDAGYTNADSVYISAEYSDDEIKNRVAYIVGVGDDRLSTKVLTQIEFDSLSDDNKNSYRQVSGNIARMIMATYFVRLYLSDMKLKCMSHRIFYENADSRKEFDRIVNKLKDLTLDSIYRDVKSEVDNSNELFNYIKE